MGEPVAQPYTQRYKEEGDWTPGLAANSAAYSLGAFAPVPLLPGPQFSHLFHGAAVGLQGPLQPREAAVKSARPIEIDDKPQMGFKNF